MAMKPVRAKLFRNGGSQAVRLPLACRFPEDAGEVLVRQDGRRVILEPADDWPDAFRECLGSWKPPIARPPAGRLRDPFA
jgi:virulence-associated protein VagC